MKIGPSANQLPGNVMTQGANVNEVLHLTAHGLDDALGQVENRIALWSKAQLIEPGPAIRLRLVLEELITNGFNHGGLDTAEGVRVEIFSDAGQLSFAYYDSANPFDPTRDLPPDTLNAPVEDRPIGKLGWVLILHYFSLIRCEAGPDGNIYGFESKPAFHVAI